jgi:predicted transcriptional regulator of viral defense system
MARAGSNAPSKPEWESLLDLAVGQGGYFTTAQAAEVGFSPELLIHHTKQGRLQRTRRGIYRVRHLPPQEDEQLIELWLWSNREGVFSHATALAAYGLSDALPASVDLTVPSAWERRRLRVPPVANLHFSDVAEQDRQWVSHVPMTTPLRTLRDCVAAHVDPTLVRQAIGEAVRSGRLSSREARELEPRSKRRRR